MELIEFGNTLSEENPYISLIALNSGIIIPMPIGIKPAYLAFIPLIALISTCNGQVKQIIQKDRYSSKDDYKNFVIIEHQLWALTANGELRLFDLQNGDPIKGIPTVDSAIIVIAKDKNSQPVIVDNAKKIRVYDNSKKTWNELGSFEGSLLGITFTSVNSCFLITNKGIVDLNTHKAYFPDSSLNKQIHYNGEWFRKPTYLMDNQDNIWVGFGYGEWGGDFFIFNTTTKKFITPKLPGYEIDLNPVKSFFSDGLKIYMSTGMDHMETSGSIVQFENFTSKTVLYSDIYKKNDTGKVIAGEYIGPGAVSPGNHYIYFYSQHGIFKGSPEKDLSSMEKWEKVLSPKLSWTYGQPDAVGSPMNVLKMEFADDKTLVFVTQLDGIGIFDGETLTMVK